MKIEITNLCKQFDNNILFNNYNLTIKDNSITCITGESGCGKTTLLNILGFQEKYKGTILYDGKEIKRSQHSKMLKNEMAFILQEEGLIRDETVLKNLRLIPKIRKLPLDQINKALQEVRLPQEILSKKAYMLSGGEQQRILFVKAMLKNVNLILADEPTAFLDEQNQQLILNLIKQFKQMNKTIIVVSHDKALMEIADDLVVIRKH